MVRQLIKLFFRVLLCCFLYSLSLIFSFLLSMALYISQLVKSNYILDVVLLMLIMLTDIVGIYCFCFGWGAMIAKGHFQFHV